jgi:threonylcarbamoyladenosine tRNA methylthiotransferase MtaB
MRVYVDYLGCRLNQSEAESLARQFQSRGHSVVGAATEADLCVINTCAVTREAEHKSRHLICRTARSAPAARIIATGCYAHLAPADAQTLPGVAHVVDNLKKDQLVALVPAGEAYEQEPLARDYVPGAYGHTRAFVKVQDGCDNRCTFCVTTMARGPGRSRALAEVVAEVQAMAAGGYQEVVLTGVHLGAYGHDRGERDGLRQLIAATLADTDIARLRLSSLEPWDLDEAFFTLWENPRLCPHLHLPLQSGCDRTLRRMARRTTCASFTRLARAARATIPDLALTTDLIAGFPGETEDDFRASYEYVADIGFAGLHVFAYSARPGTAAARMYPQLPREVKQVRRRALHVLGQAMGRAFRARYVDQSASVLWESATGADEHGWRWSGLTPNYLRVEMSSRKHLRNRLSTVRLAALREDNVLEGA